MNADQKGTREMRGWDAVGNCNIDLAGTAVLLLFSAH